MWWEVAGGGWLGVVVVAGKSEARVWMEIRLWALGPLCHVRQERCRASMFLRSRTQPSSINVARHSGSSDLHLTCMLDTCSEARVAIHGSHYLIYALWTSWCHRLYSEDATSLQMILFHRPFMPP